MHLFGVTEFVAAVDSSKKITSGKHWITDALNAQSQTPGFHALIS
jgi:hypothetical protein